MGKIITLILTFAYFHFGFSQNLKVVYDISYQPNKQDTLREKTTAELLIDTKNIASFYKNSNDKNPLNTQIYKDFKEDSFSQFEIIYIQQYKVPFQKIEGWKVHSRNQERNEAICRTSQGIHR